jgi:hypothetical protein
VEASRLQLARRYVPRADITNWRPASPGVWAPQDPRLVPARLENWRGTVSGHFSMIVVGPSPAIRSSTTYALHSEGRPAARLRATSAYARRQAAGRSDSGDVLPQVRLQRHRDRTPRSWRSNVEMPRVRSHVVRAQQEGDASVIPAGSPPGWFARDRSASTYIFASQGAYIREIRT